MTEHCSKEDLLSTVARGMTEHYSKQKMVDQCRKMDEITVAKWLSLL
jgi:hypothetical protein